MKKVAFLVLSLFLFTNCVEKKKTEPVEPEPTNEVSKDSVETRKMEPIAVETDGSYFKATGTEPFWGLKIYDNKVELQTMSDTLFTPSSEPILAQDANLKMFRIQTEATSMDIIIAHKECTNAMSGQVSPYTVTVAYKATGDDGEAQALEGCGTYITDYRLHDIWVLETLKGTQVSKDDFNGNDMPNMEININSNRFSGFSGCNRMTGSLFFEKDLLRFSQVASTRMACPNMEKESEFLNALQSSTAYKVENNRLYLSNGDESDLLTFKKID
ncbi:META domain-containing protein [Flagellimonas beolgyonensis]|uniref:META domain-containing protein n=1 Tax=Flagellimonas beolgyonensis TaxID=864064 RepID=UPI000F8CFE59|nr:META domain-containing protein [Allomuricauda beolgyonensis]